MDPTRGAAIWRIQNTTKAMATTVEELSKENEVLKNELKQMDEYKRKYQAAVIKLGKLHFAASQARKKLCDFMVLKADMEDLMDQMEKL